MDLVTILSDGNPIGWPSDPYTHVNWFYSLMIDGSSDQMEIRSDDHPILSSGRASDWDKSHNIYCLLDAHYTDNTPFKVIAKFLRGSKINQALTDKTVVYESHVTRFWGSVRYEEKEKMFYLAVRKKDDNGQDIDVEIKFSVGDLRRVLELRDSDNDPIIIPERLCKGLWCRM
ncbi:hypothetical protein Hanom_Chr10g00902971 [Helianthus anomalus]